VQIKPQSKKNAKTEYKFRHKYGPNLKFILSHLIG
jgi:hypothetical protein